VFSVIIPLYNKAAYIERAIQSVLSQTFKEFELIVVDDGSTDNPFVQLSVISYQLSVNSPEIYKKIKIIRQQNQGVSTARNNGVKLAKYEYIAFLDADDSWEPTYLEEMNSLIAAYPKAGIYGSGYYIVKNGKKRIAPIGVEKDFERGLINYCQVYSKTLCMPLTSISTILLKSVFINENAFKPDLKLGEDFDLWIRVATKYSVAFLNRSLANYHQDVDLPNRAIGEKLYKPQEHMLFTDYGRLKNNPDFVYLYERLALYGLLPYYLKGKNKKEVQAILAQIHWDQHELKYKLYYRILPKQLVLFYKELMRLGSKIKRRLNEK
jgi:glycosyltransferase involved in cell wall biosynthesis